MSYREIFIGYDEREHEAYEVCVHSILRRASCEVKIKQLVLKDLEAKGYLWRPITRKSGRLFDEISQANMSTEFAISRFLVPKLAATPYPLFMDCDMLVLGDIAEVWKNLDETKAVSCVKHNQIVTESVKMDGQEQTAYPRKNWSSFMVWNKYHGANMELLVCNELINTATGRYLHGFDWLEDDEIGEIDPAWNWLEGHQEPIVNIKNIHFTRGGPWFENYKGVMYADIWERERQHMLSIEQQGAL